MGIHLHHVLIPFLISILVVGWIHPYIVKIAILKNIVDKPDARKLQRQPVPVLGGVAIFFGMAVGIGCMSVWADRPDLTVVLMAMMAMLYVGTMDDILGLTPSLRFVVEIMVVLVLIFIGDYILDDFQGLWGLQQVPGWVAVPLTVFASVGIINAINLIDGVNGLSSGYCTSASLVFGAFFFLSGDVAMTVLSAVAAGALIPFFFHNVFGRRSKMFIGDGGTLVMGIIMSVFVISALQEGAPCSEYVELYHPNLGLVAFTLAVLAVPVFDTLRVMSTRILKGNSPFQPDKTHLHHIFIKLGCSHVATTMAILLMNAFIVLVWWIFYMCGASIDVQLYVVLALAILATFGMYNFIRWNIVNDTRLLHFIRRMGYRTHISRSPLYLWLRNAMDKI